MPRASRRYHSFRAFLIASALVLIGIPFASLLASLFPAPLAISIVTLYLTLGTVVIGAVPRRAALCYAFLYVAIWVAGIGFAIAMGQIASFLACAWFFVPVGMTLLLAINARHILAFLRGLSLFQLNRRHKRAYPRPEPKPAHMQRTYEQGYQAEQPRHASYEEGGQTYSYPYPSNSTSDQQEQPQAHYPTM